MADEGERVVYEYVGDSSSLQKATKDAIGSLSQYEDRIKQLAALGNLDVGKTAFTSFQRSLNKVIKQTNDLSKFVSTASSDLVHSLDSDASGVEKAAADIQEVLDYMNSSTKLSTDDFKLLTEQLKETAVTMGQVSNRAAVLSSHFKDIKPLEGQQAAGKVATEPFTPSKSAEESAKVIQEYYDRMAAASQRFAAPATMGDMIAQATDLGARLRSMFDTTETFSSRASKALKAVVAAFRRVKPAAKDAEEAADSEEKIGDEAEKSSRKVRKLSDGLKSLSNPASLLRKVVAGFTGLQVGKAFSKATNQSIRYTENLNLFSVAMGSATKQGHEFVEQMQELYGMDPSNLMRYAGNFYQLADAIGTPGKAASNLSLGLTKAMTDISSLFNVDIETVFRDLSSGMQGMSRAVRKYGMDIRVTTLQQTALSLGITDQVERMSEANRQGLRFITMMRQAQNASGDFAATIESPANQLRIFKEQISQLGRAIGDLFIAPLATAIQYINGFVMALRMVIQFIGAVTGMVSGASDSMRNTGESADEVAESVGGIGDAAGGAAKELKKMLAPFDELNILQKQEDSGGGGGGGSFEDLGALDPAIAEEIENMRWKLESIKMKANEVRDALLEFFGFEYDNGKILSWDFEEFKNNIAEQFPLMTEIIQGAVTVWDYLVSTFGGTFQSLWSNVTVIFQDIAARITELFNTVLKPLWDALMEAMNWLFKIIHELWVNVVEPVAKSIGDSIEQLWTRVLSPIITHIISIVGQVIEIVLNLWNNVLAPFIEWVSHVYGPLFGNVFATIWDTISSVVINIGEAINGLFTVFDGIITFLAGVFSGDWERAWEGIVEIFRGIWDTISAVVSAPLNVAIGIINTFLAAIAGGINAAIRAINRLSIKIPDWVPDYGGQTIGFNFNEVGIPQIPYLANGGIITKPTVAMVGEGKYDEAVIPLGNSPQMKELVDKLSEANNKSSQPIHVHVYVGDDQVADYMYEADKRRQLETNGGG